MAPEIEAALQAEAAVRGVSLETVMSEALNLYREEHSGQQPTGRVPFDDRRREVAWTINPDLLFFVAEPDPSPLIGGWL
jgi:hypothetical protein